MERERQALTAFVHVHGFKVRRAHGKARVVHLVPYTERGIHLDTKLDVYTVEQIVDTFDTESHLVRWVIQQIQTYDPDKQSILGLVFDKKTIMTEVLEKTSDAENSASP